MAEIRGFSSAVFNNEKFVEVVLALESQGPVATAQQLARVIGVNHDLAKKVLVRLVNAGLVKEQMRIGGSRGPLPYEIQAGPAWGALVALCRAAWGEGAPGVDVVHPAVTIPVTVDADHAIDAVR